MPVGPHPPPSLVRRPPLPEGPALVVGLGRSGCAAARLLAERGVRTLACDDGAPEAAGRLAALGVEVHLETDGRELLAGVRTVIKSPGVPREAPVIAAAREAGTELIGEMELAWRALSNPFLAVTGTNGKTTTTELLGHLYRTAGRPVAVAGNVGTPLSSLAGRVDPKATVVCECSSFQLEDTQCFAPECAVLLNISEDHLDRHGTMAAYLAAKLQIAARQRSEDVVVVNGEEPAFSGVGLGEGRVLRFCSRPGCEVTHTPEGIAAAGEPLVGAGELALLGPHNRENAAAAAAAALAMGLGPDAVGDGLRSFPGVPHRLEQVAERGGVRFVNDSKATNVASAAVGLRSFPGGVHVILGGSLKGGGFSSLLEPVVERCRACYLIGEAAPRLASDLAPAARRGVELRRCGDLVEAVRAAAGAARPGEIVLLSPACASFDAFTSYEERGEEFRAAVEALP